MKTTSYNIKKLSNQELLSVNGGSLNPFAVGAAVTIIFRAGFDFGYGLVKYLID